MRKHFDLEFRKQDYALQHEVPFLNASELVFEGLRGLLDDQVAAERRPAAIARLRRYAGLESGYRPFTEILKERELEQIAKPAVTYPAREQIETELGRNSNYAQEIGTLFGKYQLSGWEPAYARLKGELADYDAWAQDDLSQGAHEPSPAAAGHAPFSRSTASTSRRHRSRPWRTRPSRSTRPRWHRSRPPSPRRTAILR